MRKWRTGVIQPGQRRNCEKQKEEEEDEEEKEDEKENERKDEDQVAAELIRFGVRH